MRIPPQDRDMWAAKVVQQLYLGGPSVSQADVAKAMKIEKSTVSRLVKHAWDTGIVQISFALPRLQKLEVNLARRYKLTDAVVVPIEPQKGSKNRWALRQQLGQAAAAYIERENGLLKSSQCVGISCGETLRELVLSLTARRFSDMSLSQLTVETEFDQRVEFSPFVLVGMLRAKWPVANKDTYTYAIQPLPGALAQQREKEQQEAKEQPDPTGSYAWHRDNIRYKASKLDLALVGIGSCHPGEGQGTFLDILERHNIPLPPRDKVQLVGEICNRVYDGDGIDRTNEVEGLPEIMDGVNVATLQGLVRDGCSVVAVAGGAQKVAAIKTALEARFVNYLVTDVETAQKLCDAE